MTESNINPFALQVNTAPVVIPEFDVSRNGSVTPKMDDYNPFQQLVGKVPESNPVRDLENLMNTTAPRVAPKVVSTANVQDYLKRGYQLTDLDLNNPNLEQDLSSTQSKGERFMNNMKVAGANFISTAVSMFLTNPADLVDVVRFDENGNVKANSEPITEKSISSSMYNFMTDVADKNRNYETRDDVSKDLWTNITNWMPFVGNSTKGVGKILESAAFGLGAGVGIAGQEALFSLVTAGIGTVPMLAANIQKLLNSSKYLEKALKISRMAEEGAANMSRIVNAGEITNGIAKGLKTVYQSQLGSYSEALFEGLEGKESLHKQLSDDFERIHGYKPQGQELAKIEKTSTDAGITRMNINRALLSVTNFSQYNSIFKSFDAAREGAEAAAEKYGSKVILDDAGKAVVSGNKPLAKWFDSGFGKYVKPLAQVARNMKSGDVVKESLQEGMEEGLQFFTDKSLNNYYTWKHYGENKNIGDALQVATDELFKKEGLESIFTGMLAGGGQTAVTNFVTNLSPEYKQSKKDYETMQAKYAETYNELDEKLKNIPEKYRTLPETIKRQLNNVFNNNSIRGTVADKVQQANASSKLLQIKNAPADEEQFNQALTHEMFNIAVPYAKNGNVDILLKQFEAYKSLDDASFQKMWNTTDEETKNKDKIVDLYLEEFKKIQKSYKRGDNAFQRPSNSQITSPLYNTLKTELAFSFYNSDRLTQTATELENGIGKDYVDMLSNIVASPNRSVVKNKAVKKNKTEIDRINALGDIATKEEKQKAQGLEKMNQFLNEMSASTTAKETKKAIYENLVKPYQAEKGIADTYDLEEKLNKIYYLNKVKDRVKVNQDKINAILFSNNPEEYIQEREAELQIELEKIKQRDNKKKAEELFANAVAKAKEEAAKQAKKPKQPVPVVIQTQEEIDENFKRQSRTKEENLVYDIKQLEDDIENRKQAFIANGASEEEAEKLANKDFDESDQGKNRQALNKLKQDLEDLRNKGEEEQEEEPEEIDDLTEDDLRNGVPIIINGNNVKSYTVGDNILPGQEGVLGYIDAIFENGEKETFLIRDGEIYSEKDDMPGTLTKQLIKNKPVKVKVDESLIGDFNSIESKDHELAFILDDKGENIQKDMESKEAKFRATVLTNVVNGHESREAFNDKLELAKWENKQEIEAFGFVDENYFLYKKDPVSGVNIVYDGKGSVGVIPLDREVYVDATEFTIITGIAVKSETIKNVKVKGGAFEDKQVITYTQFLEELLKNPEAGNKVRAAKFILNRDKQERERNSVSIVDLLNNHKKYVAFSKFVADNIDNLNDEVVKKAILDQIDVLAFIDDSEKVQNLTPLTTLLGDEIPPIIKVTKNSDGTYTSEIVNGDVFKGEFSKEMFDEKFLIYNTNGNDNWKAGDFKLYTYLFTRNDKYETTTPMQIISAQQRPISAYKEELKTIPDNIFEYLQNTTAGVISNISKPEATRANSNFEANDKGDSLQINVEYSNGKNDLPALKDKVFIKFSLLKGKTVAEVNKIIQEAVTEFNNKKENKDKKFKFELFKSLKTIKGSYTDYSAILANNYSKRNSFQVYSTLMLKIIPNEKQEGQPTNLQKPIVSVTELIDLKQLVLNTDDLSTIVLDIFKVLDEKEYKDWEENLDPENLKNDPEFLKLDLLNNALSEAEQNNIVMRYGVLRFINEKLGVDYTGFSSTNTNQYDILQNDDPDIRTVDNVTFGTANKQGSDESNEDAVYIDNEKGVYILADGMGGENSSFGTSKLFSKEIVEYFITGNISQNTVLNKIIKFVNKRLPKVIDEDYLQGIFNIIGYKPWNFNGLVDLVFAITTKATLKGSGNRLGATALSAKRISENTYEINKVGDTVFFVVDSNNKVIQQHGLSSNNRTEGFITYVKDGKSFVEMPKTDDFTITLNEGETLVLATDFIETDKAIRDFINSDFGKNLDFAKFQKENKNDDSTFVAIKYSGKLSASNNNQNSSSDMDSFDAEDNDNSFTGDNDSGQNPAQAPGSGMDSFDEDYYFNQAGSGNDAFDNAFGLGQAPVLPTRTTPRVSKKSNPIAPVVPIVPATAVPITPPVIAPVVPAQALTPKQAQVQRIQNDLKKINYKINQLHLDRIESEGIVGDTKTLDRIVAHLYNKEGVFTLKAPIAMNDGVLRYLGGLDITKPIAANRVENNNKQEAKALINNCK